MAFTRFLQKTYGATKAAATSVKSVNAKLRLVDHQATVMRKLHTRRKKVRMPRTQVIIPKNRLRTIHLALDFGQSHSSRHRHHWVPRRNHRNRSGRRARRAA